MIGGGGAQVIYDSYGPQHRVSPGEGFAGPGSLRRREVNGPSPPGGVCRLHHAEIDALMFHGGTTNQRRAGCRPVPDIRQISHYVFRLSQRSKRPVRGGLLVFELMWI